MLDPEVIGPGSRWTRKSLQVLFGFKQNHTPCFSILSGWVLVNNTLYYLLSEESHVLTIRQEFRIVIKARPSPVISCQLSDKSPCKYPACQVVWCFSASDVCSYKGFSLTDTMSMSISLSVLFMLSVEQFRTETDLNVWASMACTVIIRWTIHLFVQVSL